MTEERKLDFLNRKKIFDIVGSKYLFDEDIEICNYVANQFKPFECERLIIGDEIAPRELIIKSLEEMKLFGALIHSKIEDITHDVTFVQQHEEFYRFEHSFDFFIDKRSLECESVVNGHYVIPTKIYEFTSPLLCHEHVHALKDTNPLEFRDTLGETIPLLVELMLFDPNDKLKLEAMKLRLLMLDSIKESYVKGNDAMNNDVYSFDEVTGESYSARGGLYDFLRTDNGKYLNSFYYAIVLYHYYKVRPKKVLLLIRMVLKQEMTTLEMLNFLRMYGDINGSIFEKELGNIRKLVKC